MSQARQHPRVSTIGLAPLQTQTQYTMLDDEWTGSRSPSPANNALSGDEEDEPAPEPAAEDAQPGLDEMVRWRTTPWNNFTVVFKLDLPNRVTIAQPYRVSWVNKE